MEITSTKYQYQFTDKSDDGTLSLSGSALVDNTGRIVNLSGPVMLIVSTGNTQIAYIQYNETDNNGNVNRQISNLNSKYSDAVNTFIDKIITDMKTEIKSAGATAE